MLYEENQALNNKVAELLQKHLTLTQEMEEIKKENDEMFNKLKERKEEGHGSDLLNDFN